MLVSLSVNAAKKPRMNKTKISMVVGRQRQLEVLNSTETISWDSSNKSVVKVTKNGLLKANDSGKAVVTATIGKQRKLKCVVRVKEKPLLPKYARVCVGAETQLSVSGTNKKVTWKSSKTKVAKVNKNGVVTGVSEGKVNIIAKVGKKRLKCKVYVNFAVSPVQSEISLGNFGEISVEHGASEIYCESSDPSVARIVIGKTTVSCKCPAGHRITDVIVCGLKDGTADITIKNNANDDEVTFKAVVTKPKDNSAKQKLLNYILANGNYSSDFDVDYNLGAMDEGFITVQEEDLAGCPTTRLAYSLSGKEVSFAYAYADSLSTKCWTMIPVKSSSELCEVIFNEVPQIIVPTGQPVPEAEYKKLNATLNLKLYDGGALTFTDLLNSGNDKHKTDANEFNKIAFDKIGKYIETVAGVSWKDLGFEKIQ